jgi:hypothetical protein
VPAFAEPACTARSSSTPRTKTPLVKCSGRVTTGARQMTTKYLVGGALTEPILSVGSLNPRSRPLGYGHGVTGR